MVDKRQRSEGFEEFLAEYNAAEIHGNDKLIYSSQFDLGQQLDRFAGFSHTKDEHKIMLKEAHTL